MMFALAPGSQHLASMSAVQRFIRTLLPPSRSSDLDEFFEFISPFLAIAPFHHHNNIISLLAFFHCVFYYTFQQSLYVLLHTYVCIDLFEYKCQMRNDGGGGKLIQFLLLQQECSIEDVFLRKSVPKKRW